MYIIVVDLLEQRITGFDIVFSVHTLVERKADKYEDFSATTKMAKKWTGKTARESWNRRVKENVTRKNVSTYYLKFLSLKIYKDETGINENPLFMCRPKIVFIKSLMLKKSKTFWTVITAFIFLLKD